jgi:hypothetical protein
VAPPPVPDEDFEALMGLSPFQWMAHQVWLALALASVLFHALATLCFGVAPVFVGAPVSLVGLPALVWVVADGVWAWALWRSLRHRWGPPRDLPTELRSAWRYGGGAFLAVSAVGLAIAEAWQPMWRGLAGPAPWLLWPVQAALPVCLPLAREPLSGTLIGAAFGAMVVSVGALRLMRLPRVFLALVAVCLAASAAWAWGESCVRFAGARSLAGVVLPAIQNDALAAPADFNAWTWALWWTGVLLWLAAAMAAAGIFHLPRAALLAMQQHR